MKRSSACAARNSCTAPRSRNRVARTEKRTSHPGGKEGAASAQPPLHPRGVGDRQPQGLELAPTLAMRSLMATLLCGLLLGCGLGYSKGQVDHRPDRALGVGARVINPGETSPALRMPGSGSSQSSTSSSGGQQSGSSTSSGSANAPPEENLTMIGGHSGTAQEEQTMKEGPAFLPLLGYPFWFLGKSITKKADRALEREANEEQEARTPELAPSHTPDDAERARLRRENEQLRDQLQRSHTTAPERRRSRSSIADELAALEGSLAPAPHPTVAPSSPPETGLSLPESVDRNADGRPDLWSYSETGGRVREALDDDHDGRVDKVLSYDAEHRLTKSEEDLDGDGVMETVTLFQDGHVVRRRTDSNGDGQTDAWSFYRAGELERHEIDRNADGFRDLVLSYRDGELSREEVDKNGDGRPDSVTLYSDGEITTTREDVDYDGVTDIESTYEQGKLVRRDLSSDTDLENWGDEAEQ